MDVHPPENGMSETGIQPCLKKARESREKGRLRLRESGAIKRSEAWEKKKLVGSQ